MGATSDQADDGGDAGPMQHAMEWAGGSGRRDREARAPALVPQAPMPVPQAGIPLARIDAPGMAAVQVARPRRMSEVLAEALEEAAAIGEDFWYAWDVGGRSAGHVEGIGIVGANTLMRAYGNCAAWVAVEAETDEAWTLRAHFVDAERCTSMSRLFRQSKQSSMGRVEPERALAMSFASGQSKAVRNVLLHALPESLKRRALAAAKEAAAKGIADGDLPGLRAKIARLFRAIGVELHRVEVKIGVKSDGWGKDEIVQVRALYRAITVEGVPAAEVFPAPAPQQATVDMGAARLASDLRPPAPAISPVPEPKVTVSRRGKRVDPAGRAAAHDAPTPPTVEPEPFDCQNCGSVHLPGPCTPADREPGEDG